MFFAAVTPPTSRVFNVAPTKLAFGGGTKDDMGGTEHIELPPGKIVLDGKWVEDTPENRKLANDLVEKKIQEESDRRAARRARTPEEVEADREADKAAMQQQANAARNRFAHVQFGLEPALRTEEDLLKLGSEKPSRLLKILTRKQKLRREDYTENGPTSTDQRSLRNPGPDNDFLTEPERKVKNWFQWLMRSS